MLHALQNTFERTDMCDKIVSEFIFISHPQVLYLNLVGFKENFEAILLLFVPSLHVIFSSRKVGVEYWTKSRNIGVSYRIAI